jgi:alpha(1,3/1,4) fucosyltransferase
VNDIAMTTRDKPRVRLNIARFWDGSTAQEIVETLLPDLTPYFTFEISDAPRVLLYGPYPGPMPRGHFVKVFIGCENLRPVMSECDWAFGVEHETSFRHPRYMRFARWGDDGKLIRQDRDMAAVLRGKTRFCAFVHANPVYYREAFFLALSRYKRVDAPSLSMNNMPSIDPVAGEHNWGTKIEFLRDYKFVIAFENASRPGYNTEKLTHAIEADCLPIYWGDQELGRSFNLRRIVYAHDYLPMPVSFLPRLPYRPHSVRSTDTPSFAARVARRFNATMSRTEQRAWRLRGFDRLVERVIEIDRDDELYLQHLREPILIDNRLPDRTRWIARWREIFEQTLA